jgi:hypothetical protein
VRGSNTVTKHGYKRHVTGLFKVPRLDVGQACCHGYLLNGIQLMVEMNDAS